MWQSIPPDVKISRTQGALFLFVKRYPQLFDLLVKKLSSAFFQFCFFETRYVNLLKMFLLNLQSNIVLLFDWCYNVNVGTPNLFKICSVPHALILVHITSYVGETGVILRTHEWLRDILAKKNEGLWSCMQIWFRKLRRIISAFHCW